MCIFLPGMELFFTYTQHLETKTKKKNVKKQQQICGLDLKDAIEICPMSMDLYKQY